MPPDSKSKLIPERIADDLLVGCQKIADELGLSLAQVYYLSANGKLPITKLGARTLIASKRVLRKHMAEAGDLTKTISESAEK